MEEVLRFDAPTANFVRSRGSHVEFEWGIGGGEGITMGRREGGARREGAGIGVWLPGHEECNGGRIVVQVEAGWMGYKVELDSVFGLLL
jgi:hypothetical protein